MTWKKRDLHALFGLEISGQQVLSLDEAGVASVKLEVETHGVLVIRDQHLTDRDLRSFAEKFGEIYQTKGLYADAGGIYKITNTDENGQILPADHPDMAINDSNHLWHTDSTFTKPRATISMLYGITVPEVGANTEFCDTRVAYETLPPDEQAALHEMVGHHSFIHSRSLTGFNDWTDEQRIALRPIARPVVQQHDASGRDALCIASHIFRIDPLDDQRARDLLSKLVEHATQPDKVYSHQWHKGDLVLWDNRCTMHRATPYAQQRDVRNLRTVRIIDGDDR